mmetsp:Transcript_30731/g.70464  ORF Transcript_30731/g.70464 Transcript_30731/m.70464 type:complete len:217 (-) Transcript_30731:419-1069(-)
MRLSCDIRAANLRASALPADPAVPSSPACSQVSTTTSAPDSEGATEVSDSELVPLGGLPDSERLSPLGVSDSPTPGDLSDSERTSLLSDSERATPGVLFSASNQSTSGTCPLAVPTVSLLNSTMSKAGRDCIDRRARTSRSTDASSPDGRFALSRSSSTRCTGKPTYVRGHADIAGMRLPPGSPKLYSSCCLAAAGTPIFVPPLPPGVGEAADRTG